MCTLSLAVKWASWGPSHLGQEFESTQGRKAENTRGTVDTPQALADDVGGGGMPKPGGQGPVEGGTRGALPCQRTIPRRPTERGASHHPRVTQGALATGATFVPTCPAPTSQP